MARISSTPSIIFLVWLAHLVLRPAYAFTPTFSTTTSQCGAFTVSWNQTSLVPAVPSFTLLLVPVNDASAPDANATGRTGSELSLPVLQKIPDAAWNTAENAGTYTITALPFRTGERFVVVMDDGNGPGTGGVSAIQTVGPNANGDACLGPIGKDANIPFVLNSYKPAQCGELSIVTGQASAIRGFVPGGSPFSLGLPTASTGNMTTAWTLNIPTGTSFVLVYIGKDNKLATTGLIQSQDSAGSGNACLANGPTSTMTVTPTVSPSSGTNSSSGGGLNVPAIVGGIIGTLAFLAICALLIFFCIIRRTDAMGRPKSRSTNSAHGRSTVEPYKDLDLRGGESSVGHAEAGAPSAAGRGAWGRLNSDASTGINGAAAKTATAAGAGGVGRKAGSGGGSGTSPVPGNGSTSTLEARFGSGLFGRKKKGRGGGANVPPGTKNNALTDSQRRAMYPGLSIASTQNQTVGTVSIPAREDGRIERDAAPAVGARPSEDLAPGGVVSRYRDAKRREAREDAIQSSDPRHSFTTDSGTAASIPLTNDQRREAAGRRGPDLSAIDETTGYGSSSYASQPIQPQRRNSLVHSDSFHDESSGAMQLADMSGNEKSSASDPSSAFHQRARQEPTNTNGRRPSTAPGAGAFHLPTSVTRPPEPARSPTSMDDTSLQLHEYPPDVKPLQEEGWESNDIPTRVGNHPYATAQSPHVESYDSPFGHSATGTTTGSISSASRRGNSGNAGGSGRGSRRVPHPYSNPSNTEFIRHTDAGPMIDSDDEEEEEENARRRVVELPPSYGEVTAGNRGQRRAGGG